MKLIYIIPLIVIFVSLYFIFYAGGAYMQNMKAGVFDMSLLVLIFMFFIIIMAAIGFMFAGLRSY